MLEIASRHTRDRSSVWTEYSHTFGQDLAIATWNAPVEAAKGFSKVFHQKDGRILDCAAGTGLSGVELTRHGYSNIDAVDMSEESLKLAEQKKVYTNIICATLGAEPIEGVEPDIYDAVICSGGFLRGHMDDRCLPELVRVLKPGGIIAITTNDFNGPSCVEGPTMARLKQEGILKSVEKYKLEKYLGDEDGWFLAYKVMNK
ncbi:ubiquinone/menaquinone biosynthesis C-methyltransferase UbiE-like isoform X2 [Ptychodera flava]|uniref:ubiquinone/menaquinone biosynthesis C-methyltransferase UbiE-like isoform X2 n=1 Tax=Ptychodera flava TaxID=63121 RepID=UPI00396AAD0F